MRIEWDEPEGAGWKAVDVELPAEGVVVDVWMQIAPSPMSMGMGDEFGVPDAWREGSKWRHIYRGEPADLHAHYVSHWRERLPGAIPLGPGWGMAPALNMVRA